MIDHEVDVLLQRFEQQLSYSGMNLDEYLSAAQENIDDFRDTVRDDAERKVRSNLIVQEIAKREGLTATEEEVEAQLEKMSHEYGVSAAEMRDMVGPDIRIIRKEIASRKALDIIADNAVVTITPIIPEGGLPDESDEKETAEKESEPVEE